MVVASPDAERNLEVFDAGKLQSALGLMVDDDLGVRLFSLDEKKVSEVVLLIVENYNAQRNVMRLDHQKAKEVVVETFDNLLERLMK